MKLYLLIALFLAATAGMQAKTLNVVCGDVVYALPAEQMGEAVCAGAPTFDVMGRTYNFADITKMYVDTADVENNNVTVVYHNDRATVTIRQHSPIHHGHRERRSCGNHPKR